MKTKLINCTVGTINSFEMLLHGLYELDVKIIAKTADLESHKYTIVTRMNIDQAKQVLGFISNIGGFMWKGEE